MLGTSSENVVKSHESGHHSGQSHSPYMGAEDMRTYTPSDPTTDTVSIHRAATKACQACQAMPSSDGAETYAAVGFKSACYDAQRLFSSCFLKKKNQTFTMYLVFGFSFFEALQALLIELDLPGHSLLLHCLHLVGLLTYAACKLVVFPALAHFHLSHDMFILLMYHLILVFCSHCTIPYCVTVVYDPKGVMGRDVGEGEARGVGGGLQ